MIYHNEGTVASYPYQFNIDENNIGEVIAYIYDGIHVTKEQEILINEKLSALPVQKDSGYALLEDKVIYSSKADASVYKDTEAAEVGIRRHFIEDFIETDDDVKEIVSPYQAHTLKTEFVIE